jgi:DNA modification methylase
MKLGRKVIGFDVSAKYLNEARRKIQSAGLETA